MLHRHSQVSSDRDRDKVTADYWRNTDRLYSEREVRDRRNSVQNMFEIATRIGDDDFAQQMAKKPEDLLLPMPTELLERPDSGR